MARATNRRAEIDRSRVRAAVEAAELRTSAEIVVAIAPFFIGNLTTAAKRAFTRLGVARTRQRNGVLVFVAPARHGVVVLADDGAMTRIDASAWHRVVRRIATLFAEGHGTEGLIAGIEHLAEVLSGAFPFELGDINELPDEPMIEG
jgi:uncharacterized membrane protein